MKIEKQKKNRNNNKQHSGGTRLALYGVSDAPREQV